MRRKMKDKIDQKKVNDALTKFINKTLDENIVEDLLHNKFGDFIYSTKYDYSLNIDDLKAIQKILALNLFDKKLDLIPITILNESQSYNKDGTQFKGRIGYAWTTKPNGYFAICPTEMQIVSFNGKDNLAKIINVVAHELIHQYDYLYGDASIKLPAKKSLIQFKLNTDNIEEYEFHGKFFQYHLHRINSSFDPYVQTFYDMTTGAFMKSNKRKNNSIEIQDMTTNLNENDKEKNDLQQLASYLSKVIKNDGTCSIELHNDHVITWIS